VGKNIKVVKKKLLLLRKKVISEETMPSQKSGREMIAPGKHSNRRAGGEGVPINATFLEGEIERRALAQRGNHRPGEDQKSEKK